MRYVFGYIFLLFFSFGCSSDSNAIDKIFGSNAPLLNSVSSQSISQTEKLSIDANNIREATNGSDEDMTYTCFYDRVVDGKVDPVTLCSDIPQAAVTFSQANGLFEWTPNNNSINLGNYEVKITGTNGDGNSFQVFSVGVRLKFSGIETLQNITGVSVDLTWTPNLQASAYQVYYQNEFTGIYELLTTFTGGSLPGATVTGLYPNKLYKLRVSALDSLGFVDTNTITRSFYTTSLVKFTMTTPSLNVVAGTAVPITVQVFNPDDSPQTIGGLALNGIIASGTSTGTFSPVTDLGTGFYTFNFTPATIGTSPVVQVTTATTTFFLNNTLTFNISPGPALAANSNISTSSNTVVSGNSVLITTQIRDQYNNPISSGITVSFAASGGVATGTFGSVNNLGNGVYTSNFTGVLAGAATSIQTRINGVGLGISTSVAVTPGLASSATSSITVSFASIQSGTNSTVTATLRDAQNNLIPGGVLVGFNKTGGSSTGTFGSTSNNLNGTYTIVYTGVLAGTAQTISVSVDAVLLTPTASITVVPGIPNVTNSSLSLSAASVISGQFVTATALLRDLNNNPIPSGVVVSFTKTGGTSTGTLNSVTNSGLGEYTIRYTGVVSGTAQNIQLVVDGSPLLSALPLIVTPAAPDFSRSSISTSASSINSGSLSTITATLRDLNNNLIPSGYAVTFSKSGGSSTGTFGSFVNAGSGLYTTTYTGIVAGTAQTISVIVDGVALGNTTSITVVPGVPSSVTSTFTLSSSSIQSGANSTLTAIIRDANSNPVPAGIVVTTTKTGGTSTGTLTSVSNDGAGVYTSVYGGLVSGTAQTIQLVVDGSPFLASRLLTVVPSTPFAANSSLTISNATINSGSSANITTTLRDLNNNFIPSGYAVTYLKTGGTSTGTFGAFTNVGDGTYTTTYSGIVAGSAQTISVLVDGLSFGNTVSVTVIPGSPSNALSTLVLSSSSIVSGSAATLTATIRDANSNPISAGILVMFDKLGGTSTGTLSSITNLGAGGYSAVYTGVAAGTAQTIQANVNGSPLGPTQSLAVTVGVPLAANSTFTLSSATVVSGSSITATALLRDLNNNPITNEYVITFDAIGGSSSGTLSGVTNLGSGSFQTSYSGVNAGTAQTVRVFYDGAPVTGLTRTATVTPGAVSAVTSTFTIAGASSATVQSSSVATLAMNLRDANSNVISNVGTIVTFVKSGGTSDGTISAVTNLGSGNYSATYTGTTMGTLQNILMYVNALNSLMSVNATVTAGPPSKILMTASPGGLINSIDCNGPYTATMYDVNNNITVSTSIVSVVLSSTPVSSHTDRIFSDSGCTTPVTGLSFPISVSAATYYYKSYVPQPINLVMTPNLGIAAANINISTQPVISWIGASAQATMNGSGSQTAYDDSTTGFYQPQDAIVDGSFMYVADYNFHRIVKYDITTNTMVGWIGHVGSNDGISAYDGSTSCDNLSIANSQLTPKWCLGGRSNFQNSNTATVTAQLYQPRNLLTDATYLYVAISHRILRFNKTTGTYGGWYGMVGASTASVAPCTGGVPTANATTPGWCTGGAHTAGSGNGQFNNITGFTFISPFLFVTDNVNNRIQRLDVSGASPVFSGWIGLIGSTAGMSPAACVTAGVNATTPTWCSGGTALNSNRYSLPAIPPYPMGETVAPNEGFNRPLGMTNDGTYLYVFDGNNYRIVRIHLTTFAFSWIGHVRFIASGANPSSPSWGSTQYSPNWTTGGVVSSNSGAAVGFNFINNLAIDTSVSPNILYFADQSGQRVGKIRTTDGNGFQWIGRNSASPTGGNPGCSSSPANAVNPGWCIGGSTGRYGNANGAFYNPTAVALSASKLYVADSVNARVQRFNLATGIFDGWIGAGSVPSQTWSRTITSGNIAARAGWDDYSVIENTGNWYMGISGNGTNLFQTDIWNRIKKFTSLTGAINGYVGVISGFGPTSSVDCVGYTSGFTPTWCVGGGRTIGGNGVHGYNNPFSITSDSTYTYIGNYSNHRIDRVRISDGVYSGWIGYIQTSPTDGDPGCNGATFGTYTPGWCINGSSNAVSNNLGFNAPRALFYDIGTDKIFVHDSSGRIIRLNKTNGAIEVITGGLSSGSGGSPACTVTSNAANRWCTTAAGTTNTTYGSMGNASGVGTNSNYIFLIDTSYHRIARYEKVTGSPAGVIGNIGANTNLNIASATFTVNSLVTTNGCLALAGLPKGAPGWCVANAVGNAISITTSGAGNSQFNTPKGIWADDTNVYVSDSGNNRIMKFNASTGAFIGWKGWIGSVTGISCLSGTPVAGAATPDWCTGGTSVSSRALGGFDGPTGMWGDAYYIYVVDNRNNRVVTVPR